MGIKLKRFTVGLDDPEDHVGYNFFCPGCLESHSVKTKTPTGSPQHVWGFNDDTEHPTFTPSVLVTWEEPLNIGDPQALRRDIEDTHRRKEAGEEHAKIPQVAKRCHSFVKNGHIEYLSDCTHSLAGQTIEMIDWEDRLSYTIKHISP